MEPPCSPSGVARSVWLLKFGLATALTCVLAISGLAQGRQFSYDASGNLILGLSAIPGPPQILGQPVGVVAAPGENASFSVTVANAAGVTFQWKFNTVDIPTATRDSLVLTNVSTTNEGQYSVVVSNSAGGVTSSDAALMLDSDGDGLPDSWELANFGNTTSQRSLGDPDGDGISNFDEFRDGTSPTNNAAFRPRLTVAKIGSGFGEVTTVPAKPRYDLGETVTLSATPLAPSLFVGWSGSLNTTSNPATLTMNSNQTVQARFVTAAHPPPGMIALWRAETDASDTIGTNHGAFYSGTNLTGPSVTATGKVGSAFDFDGTMHVRVPDSAALKPAQLTAEAWVYPTAQTNAFHTILARGSSTSSSDTWYLGTSEGIPYFYSHGQSFIQAPFAIPLNQWTHLAISFDGATKRLYVNGVQAAFQGGLGAWAYDAAAIPVTIGSDWDFNVSSSRFNGRIDEVALYDRALTASEIAGIYYADAAGRILDSQYFTSAAQFPRAYIGVGYTQQVTAVFGTAPINFALAAGALPPGMAFSPAGLLSGTPGTAGDFSFTLRATDAAAVSVEQLGTLTVTDHVTPPAGMAGWWRAESNALDSAGANHGTPTNGVAFGPGTVGQAFALNGVNQSVAIPDAPALRPASLTLEAWVRLNTTAGIQVIFSKPVGSGTFESYSLYLFGGPLSARVGDVTGFGDTLSGPALTTGRWYHVAYTFDGDIKQQILYLDGAPVASGTGNKSTGYDNQPLLLGRDSENGVPSFFLNGDLDEAAIYNRVLSGAEIASIYQAGPAGKSIAGPYLDAPPQLPDAFAGQAFAYALTSPRGTSPFVYDLITGALPPGLELDASGLISGVPTHSGIFNFVVQVTDAAMLYSERAFSLQVFAPAPSPAGLVAWWRAESNALDAAGTNHGMLTNGVTFAPGKVGLAFSLNGLGQAVVIPDAPALRLASLTLEAWVSFDSQSGLQVIFAKPLGAGDNDSYALWWVAGGFYGSVADAAGQGLNLFAPFTPTLGRWYHVAYIFDDAFNVHGLYIDGVLAASAVVTKSIAYDTQPGFLGRDTASGVPNYFFHGRIDEAAIYSRALEAWEIASIYNAGPLGKQPPTPVPPTLTIVLTATNTALLSWPSDATDFLLQQNTNLNSANWVTPSETVTDNGTSKFILVNPPTGTRFYRLFKP